MALKPQDLLVRLKVAAHPPQRWAHAALGEALGPSASAVHASVKRAAASGLVVAPGRGAWSPVRPRLLEFVLHGVRHVCSATAGPVRRGVPTAFGAEPPASRPTVAPGEAPVWTHPAGKAKGPTRSPLHRTAPQAALTDPNLPHLLGIPQALGALREQLVFEVEGAGIGPSAEQIEGLFRPFVQADAGTPRAFGGSGPGLAIARRLCRLMGGDLDVRSTIGVGSCFRITLPDTARKAG